MDADLYSSTITVFKALTDRIQPGLVIVFDELFNYPEFKDHEIKALWELLRDRPDLALGQCDGHAAVSFGRGDMIISLDTASRKVAANRSGLGLSSWYLDIHASLRRTS